MPTNKPIERDILLEVDPATAAACKNCGIISVGNFCNNCGQRKSGRITYRHIAAEFSKEIVGFESGLFYTVKMLSIDPGKMVVSYLAGVRKRYYSPLKYLFLWAAIYFILSSLRQVETKSLTDFIFNSNAPFSKESLLDFNALYLAVIAQHRDVFYLGMAPFLAAISFFLYRKRKYLYTELLVAYVYFCGQLILLTLIVFIFNFIFGDAVLIPGRAISQVIVFYLLFKMHRQMFLQNWFITIGKSLIIMYGSQILYAGIPYLLINALKLVW